MSEETVIYYQPGPQAEFGACAADIAIYGGAAGGGKSRAAVMEPLHHLDNKHFKTVIFRRTTTQIRNPGGLWDESRKVYPYVNGESHESYLSWKFPSGATVKFAGLEHDASVLDFQGAQIPLIIFDELTMFSEYQFWFMLSRNRSESGVPGYIRATCNPDVDSWVRKFIDWWIGEDGLPRKDRAGKIRWFVRMNDEIEWFDSKEAVYKRYGKDRDITPKSVTFIPAKLTDNRILMENDPAYKATLEAMPLVERERLLNGNWNIRPQAGNYFRREWFEVVNALRGGWTKQIRFWDRAATKPSPSNPDPDWTRGLKLAAYSDGTYCVVDLRSERDTPMNINRLIKNTASQDGYGVLQMCQQDPGSAGKEEIENFYKLLAGHQVKGQPFFKDKETRAKAVSAACQAGNIKVLKGPWNEEFFTELDNFPPPKESGHDDIVDCLSGAYNELTDSPILSRDMIKRMGNIMG